MRLAWFRPARCGATAPLAAGLGAAHHLDLYTETSAHDFVRAHARSPYELCVFELENTASHAFIWPYLLHYGGVLVLASPTLHDSRAQTLANARRLDDYEAEFTFSEGHPPRWTCRLPRAPHGSWPMLRVPLAAARLTAVPSRGLADALRDRFPNARIVHAPLGVPAADARPRQTDAASAVTFGILAGDRIDVARRALSRARSLGARAVLFVDDSHERLLRDADVVVALAWPPTGMQLLARSAMAAGIPVATLETILTADWPTLDPQMWRPRGASADRPIAVTIDPRDEEHSLALAVRRLSVDAALRAELGDAGRAWSHAHDSVAIAIDAWQGLLQNAARLDPPPRPAAWPPHLTPDGTERARGILADFGVAIDLF